MRVHTYYGLHSHLYTKLDPRGSPLVGRALGRGRTFVGVSISPKVLTCKPPESHTAPADMISHLNLKDLGGAPPMSRNAHIWGF